MTGRLHMQLQTQNSTSSSFLKLAERYSELLAGVGVHARMTSKPGQCLLFDALSQEEKNRTLEMIESDIELFQEMDDEGDDLRDSPKLLWRYLRRRKLTPCNDIFDKIENEDVVSVYDITNRQIFQNMRFLELVSLTIEQIFCSPWFLYSTRSPEIEKSLYETAASILSGQVRKTICPPAPEHIAQEVGTEGLVRLKIKVKWVSPVFSSGQVAAMLVINRCSPSLQNE